MVMHGVVSTAREQGADERVHGSKANESAQNPTGQASNSFEPCRKFTRCKYSTYSYYLYEYRNNSLVPSTGLKRSGTIPLHALIDNLSVVPLPKIYVKELVVTIDLQHDVTDSLSLPLSCRPRDCSGLSGANDTDPPLRF